MKEYYIYDKNNDDLVVFGDLNQLAKFFETSKNSIKNSISSNLKGTRKTLRHHYYVVDFNSKRKKRRQKRKDKKKKKQQYYVQLSLFDCEKKIKKTC